MSSQSVGEFFDSYSDNFNALYESRSTFFKWTINTIFRRSMWLRFSKTIEGCTPIEGRTVLDVGCGPGHYAVALAKKNAKRVYGIDFAQRMLDLAAQNARRAGVTDRCSFLAADFLRHPIQGHFDYVVVMGVMDCVRNPSQVIQKVLAVTQRKAFFSFPVEEGVLAWQRKLRYKTKCDLFMYTAEKVKDLFIGLNYQKLIIEKIGRDFFISVQMNGDEQDSRRASRLSQDSALWPSN